MGLFDLGQRKVTDQFLGDMEITVDKDSNKFILAKTETFTPSEKLDIYFETSDKIVADGQRQIYRLIKNNFDKVTAITFDFLINDKKYLKSSMTADYKAESITIFDKSDNRWELDLLNLSDGFSHIIIEFDKLEPIDFEVRA
jgi:hypothetical protein